MKNISRILAGCLFVCFAHWIAAQDIYQTIQPIDAVMKARQFRDGSNEKQVFASLAVNNIRNIHQVSIYLKGDLLVSVKKDKDGHLFSYVKMLHAKISGDVEFRSFPIDSLLMPKAFEGYLYIYYGKKLLAKIPVEMLLSGGVLDLESIEYAIPDFDHLQAEIEVTRFYFSDDQFQQYMDLANAINMYYSYNEVMRLLLDDPEKSRLNRGMSSAATFIAWHEINRVKSYIELHELKNILHLEKYDPAQFLDKKEKLFRLERRASTLFIKELEAGKRGKLSDRDKYCHDYIGLSLKYINLTTNYQPNMVAAFNEMVHIYPVEQDLQRMSNAAAFYDIFKITGVAPTTQRIYNYFVDEATSELKKQEFLNALALIKNARQLELFFTSISGSDKLTEVYVQSLDGLMSSFLQVSVMAYKSRNFKMAKRYYRNAQKIYDEHAALLGNDEMVANSFRLFVEKQVELAGLLLDDESYGEAITLLDDAKNMAEKHDLPIGQLNLDSGYRKGFTGIYERLVDSVEYYLELEKQENSLSLLLSSTEFEQEHASYLQRDERIVSYAYILYDKFYESGLAKLQGKHPEQAIVYLQQADKINNLILHQKETDIDSLISAAVVPVINDYIKKAEFEVWANRLENAEKIRQKAVELQQKYGLEENKEINSAISSLGEKIRLRVCVSLQYKADNTCRVVENRIKAGKIGEAEQKLTAMERLLAGHPECVFDRKGIDSLRKTYGHLFTYYKMADHLTENVTGRPFEDLLATYDQLQKDYATYKLNRYIRELPELTVLVNKYGDSRTAGEAVIHYLDTGDYKQAFAYLKIWKNKGADARTTKYIQKKVGEGLCSGVRDKKTYISNLTGDDPYYKALRSACIKK